MEKVPPFNMKSLVIKVVIAIVALWLITLIILYLTLPNWENRGQFGDMFGAVNALFSGLALAGVILAIVLQKNELELQREELKLTRDELERAAKAQEGSRDALSKQVELLHTTAVMESLNSAIEIYDRRITRESNATERLKLIQQQKIYMDELEKMLNQIR